MPSWTPPRGILCHDFPFCWPEAVHWELVPSVGLGKPFPPGLAGRGSWEVALCDSQSVHKHPALGGRGLGLQPQQPCLAVFLKLTLYSAVCGQTNTNAPGGVAGAGK